MSATSDDGRVGFGRRRFLQGAAAATAGAAPWAASWAGEASAAAGPTVVENARPGTDDDWDVVSPDASIEGFPTQFSVNAGETIGFKIRTGARDYRVVVYRLGWYAGKGARSVATLRPPVLPPRAQPDPVVDRDTGRVDCSNWSVSVEWPVPVDAVSGVYVANLERLDTPGVRNRVLFVVRNDGRTSDLLVQTSDTTYQAYNVWGGYSLYRGSATWGRATKVSYDRPYAPEEIENDFFYGEYPLVRWLERNGFDVAYCAGVDTDRRPAELLRHRVFVSSGHDEYWSGAQRANVEAARDAGVHLVFMTGNEVFWRVRWEPNAAGTPHRTLVCYKETLAGAKIDPSSEWTGTWRDQRFVAAGSDVRPENALTGTLFRVIYPVSGSDAPIRVPAAYRALRIWRNTDVASLAPGAVATLGASTLGYEWNTDADNGFRPAGLIRLSETTEAADQVLQDAGVTYVPGTATHHLTMYRASSGALVWSTGTVQWAWGLDAYHANRPDVAVPTDVRMQQATMNVLVDMGAQPSTPMAGLVVSGPSGDTLAPTCRIDEPVEGSRVTVGTPVQVVGTAVDTGGGVVAAVEVSVDDGLTWHPAVGTASWTASFVPNRTGPWAIRARAVDDSCNTEPGGVRRTIDAVTRPMPCSLWSDAAVPAVPATADTAAVELGVRFRSDLDGFVTAVRFYRGQGNVGPHRVRIWTTAGLLIGSGASSSADTAVGWRTVPLDRPVAVRAGDTYVASYTAPAGRYAADRDYFRVGYALAPLSAPANGDGGGNGVYRYGEGFPDRTYAATNYWVDVVFDVDDGAAPVVTDRSPAAGVESVDPATTVRVRFSDPVDPTSLVVGLVIAGDPNAVAVTGSIRYDAATTTATFTPAQVLRPSTRYTVTVSGRGADGTTLLPVGWSFTTAGPVGSLPTSLWTSAAVPAVAAVADTSPVEVGVRFRSDVAGVVTAIRYHRGPGNAGPHVGRLWTVDGRLLGTATFADEATTGWQQAPLDPPVPIAAGVVHVASVYDPAGRYSADVSGFTAEVARGPLRAPASGSTTPNGVHTYAVGGGFPVTGWSATNYWVDVVVAPPPTSTGPVVENVVPAPGLWSVDRSAPVTVRFERQVASATVVLRGPAGESVPVTVVHDGDRRVDARPDGPLAPGVTYTASVTATDTTGVAMREPFVWTFVTRVPDGSTPATVWSSAALPTVVAASDQSAVEVGVRFSTTRDLTVLGVRFYKGPGNLGPHPVRLWSIDGTLLASAVTASETAEGWQQALFAQPVDVVAGRTLVASYHAPAGRYATTTGGLSGTVTSTPLVVPGSSVVGGNGVFRYGTGGFPDRTYASTNYWVDVIVADRGGPQVVDRSPAPGATGVDPGTTVGVAFSEPVGTVVFELRDATGAVVPTTLSHAPAATTATLRPVAPLTTGAVYTAVVVSATDLDGNASAAPTSWSFTVRTGSVWTLFGSAVPRVAASTDAKSVEVGTKFRVTVPCEVIGLRFHQGPGNTGPHVGRLWNSTGTRLAEAAHATASTGGWRSVTLATPVAVDPGRTYIVSCSMPAGRYSVDAGYFDAGPVTNGPIVGTANVAGDRNGVYKYGGGFPTNSYKGSNYWVDVVVRERS